jgi:ClpA/ClpB-like protein
MHFCESLTARKSPVSTVCEGVKFATENTESAEITERTLQRSKTLRYPKLCSSHHVFMGWLKSFLEGLFAPDPDPEDVPNNLTPRAKQVLTLARQEAKRLKHNFIGTEHLLLGLVKLGQGLAGAVLVRMGLSLEDVRREVEQQTGGGIEKMVPGPIPWTPRVKKVLALAAEESNALNHTYVGTEHILLGLLREGDNFAARVLKNLGVDIETTRQNILKEMDANHSPPPNQNPMP